MADACAVMAAVAAVCCATWVAAAAAAGPLLTAPTPSTRLRMLPLRKLSSDRRHSLSDRERLNVARDARHQVLQALGRGQRSFKVAGEARGERVACGTLAIEDKLRG